MSYGWRGHIGYLTAGLWSMDRWEDFRPLIPPGVAFIVASNPVTNLDKDVLHAAFERAEQMAKLLASEADVMIMGGQPVYTLPGEDHLEKLLERIRTTTGKTTTTTLLAAIEALERLEAKKVVFVTPTKVELAIPVRNFLTAKGLQVVATKTMDIVHVNQCAGISSDSIYRLAKQGTLEAPQADAIFMNCGRMPVSDIITKLEGDLGKPVVTTQQAIVWWGLRQLGVKDKIAGYGKIMEML